MGNAESANAAKEVTSLIIDAIIKITLENRDAARRDAPRRDFMVYPRDLSIAWGETPQYWTWIRINSDSDNTSVEVPRLVEVFWLDVAGKFDMSTLQRDTRYSVVFKVKKEVASEGWNVPVNLTLNLPDGTSSLRKASLNDIPVDTWIDLSVGDFIASGPGSINFSMSETSNTNRKSGLIIKGVQIKQI